jgi:hypothetical protein
LELNGETFALNSTIKHSGSFNNGHYTVNCRDPTTEKWYHINDSKATEIGEFVADKQAYILFYEKKQYEEHKTEVAGEEKEEKGGEEKLDIKEAVRTRPIRRQKVPPKLRDQMEKKKETGKVQNVTDTTQSVEVIADQATLQENERGDGYGETAEKDSTADKHEESGGEKKLCTCRMTYKEDSSTMMECGDCAEWFHTKCIKFSCNDCTKEAEEERKALLIDEKNAVLDEKMNKIEEMRHQMKVKSEKILAMENEAKITKKKIDDLQKKYTQLDKESEKNKQDLTRRKVEAIANEKAVKDKNKSHDKTLSQFEKQKKDLEELKVKIVAANKNQSAQSKRIAELEAENKRLSEENVTHVEFVGNMWEGNDFMGQQNGKNDVNKQDMEKKDERIEELIKQIHDVEKKLELNEEEMGKSEPEKVLQLRSEVKNLKAQMMVNEDTLADWKDQLKAAKKQLNITTTDLNTEKDTRKVEIARLQRLDQLLSKGRDNIEDEGENKREENPKTPKKRDCKWEKQCKGSCRFKERCFFNHDIEGNEDNQHDKTGKVTGTKAQDIDGCTETKSEDQKKMEARRKIFCRYEKAEKGSCRHKENCHFSHDTPSKVPAKEIPKSGGKPTKPGTKICFKEFEGTGNCENSKCRFSHDITDEMREDEELIAHVLEKKNKTKQTAKPGNNYKNVEESTKEKKEETQMRDENVKDGQQDAFLYLIRCVIQAQQQIQAQMGEILKTK